MPRLALLALALLAAGCSTPDPPPEPVPAAPRRRLVVLSLDGLPWDIAKRKMSEGRMPHLKGLVARGACAEGSVTAWPAVTAPGHATLWTGRWADGHGVLGNTTPALPRSRHSALETVSGFEAAVLRAEPIWRVAAKAGRSVVVVQATHADPYNPAERDLRNLRIFNGYREPVPPALVTESPFAVDGVRFLVESLPDAVRVWSGEFEVRIPLKESAQVDLPGIRGAFTLHLARLDKDGFALFRSSYSRLAGPSDADVARYRAGAGGCAYESLKLDEPWFDGQAWKRDLYVAATRIVIERAEAGIRWAIREYDPDLVIAYVPQPDHALHLLLGEIEIRDRREAEAVLDEVLALCDGLVGAAVDAAGPEGAVAIVSDHGMAPVDRVFFPNLVLERAGLLERDEAGRIRLSRTQVLFAPGDRLVVNTSDREGGIVPLEEKESWLAIAEKAVMQAAEGALGPGALATPMRPSANSKDLAVGLEGDSWLSVTSDGVRLNAELSHALLQPDGPLARPIPPKGHHSGDPREPRLRGILIFGGAGFRHASAAGVRHVDFAPTVARWLGVDPPRDVAGRVLAEFLEDP